MPTRSLNPAGLPSAGLLSPVLHRASFCLAIAWLTPGLAMASPSCLQEPDSGSALAVDDQATSAADEEWIQLFNGQDLTGWTPKIRGYELGENFANTFRVVDGVLQVNYDGYGAFDDRFGHLFHEQTFSHYILRIEYRFTGDQVPGGPGWAWRNSGVMLHGQDPRTMERNQSFPVSIEAQFLGGNGRDPRPTMNLCTPGTHVVINGELVRRHCTDSTAPTIHGDEWVTVAVEVRGSRLIRHFVNDQMVLEYGQPQLDPGDPDARRLEPGENLLLESGTISLQSESHPVEFRKVELRLLDPDELMEGGATGGAARAADRKAAGDGGLR